MNKDTSLKAKVVRYLKLEEDTSKTWEKLDRLESKLGPLSNYLTDSEERCKAVLKILKEGRQDYQKRYPDGYDLCASTCKNILWGYREDRKLGLI